MKIIAFVNLRKTSGLFTASIASLMALSIQPAFAIAFKFEKLVDNQTTMPGDGRSFTGFDQASISGSSVVFRGTVGRSGDPSYREGIYLLRDRALSKIVDLNTKSPSPGFSFSGFTSPILSGNVVAFLAVNPERSISLYRQVPDKPLQIVADPYTRPANNNPYFWRFGATRKSPQPAPIHMDGNVLVFEGGTYGAVNGQVRSLAYAQSGLPTISPRVSANRIVSVAGKQQIRLTVSNGITPETGLSRVIAAHGMRLPDGSHLKDFGKLRGALEPVPVISSRVILFYAQTDRESGGLYTHTDTRQGGRLEQVLTLGETLPQLGPIKQVSSLAVSGVNLGFGVRSDNVLTAIGMRVGGQRLKVVHIGDAIEGKRVVSIAPLGTQFLSGRTMVMILRFADGMQGIYRSTAIPETPEEAMEMEKGQERE